MPRAKKKDVFREVHPDSPFVPTPKRAPCTQCGRFGVSDELIRPLHERGTAKYCITCWALAAHSFIDRAAESERLDGYYQRKYGIDFQKYGDMFLRQHGKCAICLQPPQTRPLFVDHDHATGQVRGLLCDHCNRGLGYFRDNPAALGRAISYLVEPTTWVKSEPDPGLRLPKRPPLPDAHYIAQRRPTSTPPPAH